MTERAEPAIADRPPWGRLLAVVAAAALVRIIVDGIDMVIGADGPAFLRLAGQFARGEWAAALSHDYHPLYPLLAGAATKLGLGLERAATLTSLVAGSLVPLPLFHLGRRLVGDRAGLIAGLLWALHPDAVRLSVDQKSDVLHLLLFISAMALAVETTRTGRLRSAAAAGLLSGLAFLARPEGLGVALFAAAWVVVARHEWPGAAGEVGAAGRGRRLVVAATLLVAAAIPAAPYAVAISLQDGRFQITRKKGLSDLIGREAGRRHGGGEVRVASIGPSPLPAAPAPGGEGSRTQRLREERGTMGAVERFLLSVQEVVSEYARRMHPLLLLLGLFGGWSTRAIPRPRPRRPERFVLCAMGAYSLLLLALVLGVSYLSRRHVFPMVALSMPWSAAGLVELAHRLAPRLAARPGTRPLTPEPRLLVILVGAVLLALAPVAFYPQRIGHLFQRVAGEWIGAVSGGQPGLVLTPHQKIAYYAGAGWQPLAPSYEQTIALARDRKVRYVAFYREKVDRYCKGFLASIRDEDLVRRERFVHRVPGPLVYDTRELTLEVYLLRYPGGDGPPGAPR